MNDAITSLRDFSETPRLEIQVIAAHVLGQSRTWVTTHDDIELDSEQLHELNNNLNRLLTKEPLPYIIGEQEFFGLPFRVNPYVLIPRPETEQLVEITIQWLKKHPDRRQGMDIGTGSGCIPISLCKNIPDLSMVASDISGSALEVARQNAQLNGVENRISFKLANLYPSAIDHIDFLCANLPYIPANNLATLDVSKFEPLNALDGGENGFTLIEELLTTLQYTPPSFMILEMDCSHAEIAKQFTEITYPNSMVNIIKDLTDRDRFLIIESEN